MDFENLFSFATLMMVLAALGGALVHYWKGNLLEASVMGFWDWLAGKSPVKSIAVGVLLMAGAGYLSLSGADGVMGWSLAGFYGYFLDSVLKRV